MVGASLALQLAAVLPQDISICLVEGYPLPAPLQQGTLDYHPSFDARSTALSYSSRLIYEKVQLWDELQQWLCPIESIHVSNRGRFGSTLLRAADYGWSALGYVVENAWLGNALVQALYRQGRVEVRSPARVTSARVSAGGVALQLEAGEAEQLDAALLLVVDGAGSGLREQLGVAVTEFVLDVDDLPEVLEPLIAAQCIGRGICRLLEQRHPLVTDGREVQRLLQVAKCLSRRTKGGGPLRSAAQPIARAGGQRLGIGARWRGLERLQVVRGDHDGQLVIASRLEVVGGSQVSATTVGLGQHAVGDLADDALHE